MKAPTKPTLLAVLEASEMPAAPACMSLPLDELIEAARRAQLWFEVRGLGALHRLYSEAPIKLRHVYGDGIQTPHALN